MNNGDLSMIFSVGGLSQGISGLLGTYVSHSRQISFAGGPENFETTRQLDKNIARNK